MTQCRVLPVLWVFIVGVLAGCQDDAPPPLLFNFHAIQEGKAYRSAQPSGPALESIINDYGVKTVVNLRGEHPGDAWYDEEAAVCRNRGVTLVSHAMSAGALPKPAVLRDLSKTLQTAEGPILIHCQGGADRSGAAAAMYRILVLGHDKTAAASELSPNYFHFAERMPCMDKLIELYQPTPEWLDWYEANYATLNCTSTTSVPAPSP